MTRRPGGYSTGLQESRAPVSVLSMSAHQLTKHASDSVARVSDALAYLAPAPALAEPSRIPGEDRIDREIDDLSPMIAYWRRILDGRRRLVDEWSGLDPELVVARARELGLPARDLVRMFRRDVAVVRDVDRTNRDRVAARYVEEEILREYGQ